MHKGSCLCGSIQYEINGEIGNAYFCHCRRCRKASGSAFATNAKISPEQFKLISGKDVIKSYTYEETGLVRKFCSNCGSPIISERTSSGITAIRLGTLDTPIDKTPIGHIFAASKAEWFEISDNMILYDERPVG